MFETEEGSSGVSYLARLDPEWQRLESERLLEEYAEEEWIEQAYNRQQSAVNVSQFEMAELAALVDEKELWKSWGHQSLEHWISWRSGVSKGEAGKRARVARALKQFPKAREAFSQGKLSLDKMATLVRIADQDSEESLLYLALQATASQFSLRLEELGTELNPSACHEDQDGGRLNLHDVIASLFSSVEARKAKRRAS